MNQSNISDNSIIILDELLTVSALSTLGHVNMVDPERTGSSYQGDGSEDLVVEKMVSVCENVRKRGEGELGCDFEGLEVFSKKAKIEAIGDSSDSERLSKALKRLSLCKAKRSSCEGSSDKSKEVADSNVSFAESILHAEILLKWVSTIDELKTAKASMKVLDGEVTKLQSYIFVMRDESKDAAMKHTLMTRIGMMMESAEAKTSWDVKD